MNWRIIGSGGFWGCWIVGQLEGRMLPFSFDFSHQLFDQATISGSPSPTVNSLKILSSRPQVNSQLGRDQLNDGEEVA